MTTILEWAEECPEAVVDINYYTPSYYGEGDEEPSRYDSYSKFRPASKNDRHILEPHQLYVLPRGLGGCNLTASVRAESNARLCWKDWQALEGVYWLDGGHGTFQIAIRGDVENKDIVQTLDSLLSYPVLDEMDLGELENEAQEEAWSNWVGRDFKSKLEGMYAVWLDETPDEKLKELFTSGCEDAQEYWVEESGGGWYINVGRVAATISREAVLGLPGCVPQDTEEEPDV